MSLSKNNVKTGLVTKVSIIYFLLGLVLARPLIAEKKDAMKSPLDPLVYHFYDDTKGLVTRPLHWERRDCYAFGLVSLTTLGLLYMDDDFRKFVQRNRSYSTDKISEIVTPLGGKRGDNLIIGTFVLSGFVFKNKKLKDTGLYCFESLILAEGITISLKYLVGRSRPFADKGAFSFNSLHFPSPGYSQSFPSGHVTSAFSLASTITEQYHQKIVLFASYSLAVAVAYSRLNADVHFLSDVFFGACVGYFVGKFMVRFNQNKNSYRTKIKASLKNKGVKFLYYF
jgi:membrane-associated phospholipid phosphatase